MAVVPASLPTELIFRSGRRALGTCAAGFGPLPGDDGGGLFVAAELVTLDCGNPVVLRTPQT